MRERVQISDTEMGKDGVITADASILPDVDDFPKEEAKALFEKMKQDILRFSSKDFHGESGPVG